MNLDGLKLGVFNLVITMYFHIFHEWVSFEMNRQHLNADFAKFKKFFRSFDKTTKKNLLTAVKFFPKAKQTSFSSFIFLIIIFETVC